MLYSDVTALRYTAGRSRTHSGAVWTLCLPSEPVCQRQKQLYFEVRVAQQDSSSKTASTVLIGDFSLMLSAFMVQNSRRYLRN